MVKTNLIQFDQETFGTKYVLTSLTLGTKTVPKVKNFGAKFVPKELMQFGLKSIPTMGSLLVMSWHQMWAHFLNFAAKKEKGKF